MRSTTNVTIRDHLLPSWVDDQKSECCEWERVTCNYTTGHVTHLSLHIIWEIKRVDYLYFMPWFLNASLFDTFKELRGLDLSLNAIGGWIKHKGMLIYILSVSYISVMTVIYPMLISVSANK